MALLERAGLTYAEIINAAADSLMDDFAWNDRVGGAVKAEIRALGAEGLLKHQRVNFSERPAKAEGPGRELQDLKGNKQTNAKKAMLAKEI